MTEYDRQRDIEAEGQRAAIYHAKRGRPTIGIVERQARLIEDQRRALIEAHMVLCYMFQSFMLPPSQTDGRYEDSMRVWNLDPKARGLMDGCQQALYDELMKLQPDPELVHFKSAGIYPTK
jgi:hypothetical protein